MGVISFYDVAKAVVDSQDFENRMLKAYIRDWPVESRDEQPRADARIGSATAAAQRRRSRPRIGPRMSGSTFGTSFASPTSAKATARRSAA